MSGNIERLIRLQELDLRIRRLEKELRDLPRRKQEEESRLLEHRQAVTTAEQTLRHHESQIRQIELELAGLTEKIEKLRQQQLQLRTNREFRAMEEEIEGVRKVMRQWEDQELALMEAMESARTELADQRQKLQQEEVTVRSDLAVLDQRACDLEREIVELQQARRAAAEGIDSVWLERYTMILSRKDRAIVPLRDRVCGGCYMSLPPSVFHAAHRGDEIVTCNYCGRMLYCPFKESATAEAGP